MHITKWIKSKSVLWAWAGSYIIVLFIPLITVFINYGINVRTIKQGIMSANELTLHNIGDNIDRILEAQEEIYKFILTNEYYMLLQDYDSFETEFYHNTGKFFEELSRYRGNSGYNINTVVSFEALDFVISARTGNVSRTYYNSISQFRTDWMSYDEWYAILNANYKNVYFTSKDLSGAEKNLCLYFANTFQSALEKPYHVMVGVSLDEIAVLTEYLEPEMYLNLRIEDTLAATFHNGEIVNFSEENMLTGMEEKEWINMSTVSNKPQISYSLTCSKEYYQKELADTNQMFLMNVSITLLFGLVGTFLLIRLNYKPVRELLKETNREETNGNEFQKIAKVYQELKLENRASQKVVDSQKKELMSSWLLSMMKGRTTSLQVREWESYSGLDIKGNIAMAGFMIPISDKVNIKYDELLFFVVDNIFMELMEGIPSYRVEDGRFLLYLFDLQDISEEEWMRRAADKAEYMCNLLEERWKIQLIGVISNSEEEFSNVRFLYQRIMECFEYQNVIGGSGISTTQSLENQQEGNWLIEYTRTELSEALKSGELEKAMEVTNKLFERMTKLPFVAVKIHIWDSFNVVADIFKEYETDAAQQVNVFRYVELLMSAHDINSQKEIFGRLMEFVCERITVQVRIESGGVVDKVKKYIVKHYQDSSLNISTIAEDMRRNPKYISRVFKEETGEGILDYINCYRIRQAREIMAAGKCTVDEVAEQVGYANSRSFRRAFAKITGDTPGKYIGQ